jgi:FkbM family methyltransferase
MTMRKLLRTAQTLAPWARDLKHELQHLRCELLRTPFEPDFRVLAHFDPPPEEEFVDVGANRGQSVQAIKLARPDSRIVCFEPSAHSFRRLARRLRRGQGVRAYNVGLGSQEAACTLYTPSYNGYVFDGLASTDEAEARAWLNPERLYFFSSDRLTLLTENVPVRRLDDFDLKPCFIKIDVQGGELDVLRGASRLIAEHRPIVLIEAPSEDREIALLRPLGYEAFSYDGVRLRAGLRGGRNAFLIPPNRRSQLRLELVETARDRVRLPQQGFLEATTGGAP